MFRRSPQAEDPGAAVVRTWLEYLRPLGLGDRAAEVLTGIAPQLAEDALPMDQALRPWLPNTDWSSLTVEQRQEWIALSRIVREAFQALVFARLLIRNEQTYQGATWITYVTSADGQAALQRGDVAQVIARRLPD